MAYYCLHKLHILPNEYMQLDNQEKAFVVAAVEIRVESDKKREREMKNKSRKKG